MCVTGVCHLRWLIRTLVDETTPTSIISEVVTLLLSVLELRVLLYHLIHIHFLQHLDVFLLKESDRC